MIILDTVKDSWSISTPINSPTRSAHTATLLPNGVIVYIGGVNETQSEIQIVDIREINLFDTKSSAWSVKVRMNDSLYFFNYTL